MKPSRAMITGEISWAWIAIALAWSGSGLWPYEQSYLHIMLAKRDLDEFWIALVGAPAAALMFFSLREYHAFRYPSADFAKRWSILQIEASARCRGRMCFALVFSWLYVAYVLAKASTRPSVMLPVAIGGAVFMLWFWVENRRVQRDIRKQTGSFPAASLR